MSFVGTRNVRSAAEQNRSEIATLRQEISTLLQCNGQLHQQLGQLNSVLLPPQMFRNGGNTSGLHRSSEGTGGASALWPEEQQLLQARARELSQKCRSLELSAEAKGPAVEPRGDSPGIPASALASLLRERDDLYQRIHATELARCAAEQRRSTTEAALVRTLEELDGQRKLVFTSSMLATSQTGELEALKKELSEAQEQLAGLDMNIVARSEQIKQNEHEYAEVRIEYDALAAANESLRDEFASARLRIAAEQQGCRKAEQELHELQAALRAGESEFTTELDALKSRRRAIEASLRETSSTLASAESEAAEARAKSLGMKAQLEVLRAARDELKAHESKASEQHQAEVAALEAKAAELNSEASHLTQRFATVRASVAELQALQREYAQQQERQQQHEQPQQHTQPQQQAHQQTFQQQHQEQCQQPEQPQQQNQFQHPTKQQSLDEIADEHLREAAAERLRRVRAEVSQAENRLTTLLRRLGEEKRHSLELTREVAAAREAAALGGGLFELSSPQASSPANLGRKIRRSSSSAGRSKQRSSSTGSAQVVPATPASLQSSGDAKKTHRSNWAAGALQMQRELEMLQRWKTEALSAMQKMQADVVFAQEKYRQQLKHNQGLQSQLEHMGVAGPDGAIPSPPSRFRVGKGHDDMLTHKLLSEHQFDKGQRKQVSPSMQQPLQQQANFTQLRRDPGVVSGPDVPERPDLPNQLRAAELLPTGAGRWEPVSMDQGGFHNWRSSH